MYVQERSWKGLMGNLYPSSQITEGTFLTVCSGHPTELTDQEEENVGAH